MLIPEIDNLNLEDGEKITLFLFPIYIHFSKNLYSARFINYPLMVYLYKKNPFLFHVNFDPFDFHALLISYLVPKSSDSH